MELGFLTTTYATSFDDQSEIEEMSIREATTEVVAVTPGGFDNSKATKEVDDIRRKGRDEAKEGKHSCTREGRKEKK